jgi:hypothetical protein
MLSGLTRGGQLWGISRRQYVVGEGGLREQDVGVAGHDGDGEIDD